MTPPATTPRHTKEMSCECGCGRTMQVSLDTVRFVDGLCLLGGYRRPKMVTDDLFAPADMEQPTGEVLA